MDSTAILNYPGSKRRLLDFIYKNSLDIIDKSKIILDIFAGTGCVAQYFKQKGYKVTTNDTEIYSSNISNAILNGCDFNLFDKNRFIENYNFNKYRLYSTYSNLTEEEADLIKNTDLKLVRFDSEIPKIWNVPEDFCINGIKIKTIDDLNIHINEIPFCLFTLYYSGTYFGLYQSIEIDSIRYAIEKSDIRIKATLLTCLYYAMKEASFSKDGHMAQPLNHEKNFKRLIGMRSKNILELFFKELEELSSVTVAEEYSRTYNMSFLDLIEDETVMRNVGFIYADPPYTDMQYSRYFHLLTTISNYVYPNLTLKKGKLTTGLYANNRFQSTISSRSKALGDLTKLIKVAAKYKIPLMFSYGYPVDRDNQPTNRYTMCIDDLINNMRSEFPEVKIVKENFQHCNNRNNSTKKVFEYLIIGLPDKIEKDNSEENIINWCELKEKVMKIKASNKSLLYNTMLYWSQKPFNITDILIENLSSKHDVILDPFMGSGVTVLEAANKKNNRKAIGIDINDMPIFLCKNSIVIPDEKDYEIIKNIKNIALQYNSIYDTVCCECGNAHGKISKIVYDIEPELNIRVIYYTCDCSKKVLQKSPSAKDYESFFASHRIIHIKDWLLLPNSKIGVRENNKISDKFSKRSFYALDIIKGLIKGVKEEKTRNILWYIFASIIHKTKILDVKLSSQWPLWIPKKNCVERNVFEIFADNIEKYIASRPFVANFYNNNFAKSFWDLKDGDTFIIQKGIQNIDEAVLPSESVDLVITDPPYLEQVPYSEYMQLYRPFIDNYINFDDEIVMSNAKDREKDYSEYFSLMKTAFKNIVRIMKKNSIICLYFHDSDLKVWNDLINTFTDSGLVFETCMHIDKSQKTLKKIIDPKKTMSGETLLFLRKKSSSIQHREFSEYDILNIKNIAETIIKSSPQKTASTSKLYDNGVLTYIISEGILASMSKKYKDLTDIFSKVLVYNSDIGVWECHAE